MGISQTLAVLEVEQADISKNQVFPLNAHPLQGPGA